MASWIIPSNPAYYDVETAFLATGSIIWHQQGNVSAGDTVYIYVTAPVQAIRFKCTVTEANIPVDTGDDDGCVIDEAFCARTYRRYMELRLEETCDNPFLSYRMLLMNGLTGAVRSQRKVPMRLERYLAEAANAEFK